MTINKAFMLLAAALLVAPAAYAQTEVAPGASVSFVGGAASTNDVTGAVLGASALVDLNDRVGLEGEATYLDRGAGTSAFSASGSLLVSLLPSRGRVAPYAAAGGGLYRTSFDLGDARLLGPAGSQFQHGATICAAPGSGSGFGPGPGFGPGTGECPNNAVGYWGVGRLPAFYGRRLGPMVVPVGDAWGTRSFTDPAATIGGGVRFNVTDRLMVRPDVRARIIFADDDTYTMAVVSFNLGYRF